MAAFSVEGPESGAEVSISELTKGSRGVGIPIGPRGKAAGDADGDAGREAGAVESGAPEDSSEGERTGAGAPSGAGVAPVSVGAAPLPCPIFDGEECARGRRARAPRACRFPIKDSTSRSRVSLSLDFLSRDLSSLSLSFLSLCVCDVMKKEM